jgi:hypothetical protein
MPIPLNRPRKRLYPGFYVLHLGQYIFGFILEMDYFTMVIEQLPRKCHVSQP